jgi:hypothetical protein
MDYYTLSKTRHIKIQGKHHQSMRHGIVPPSEHTRNRFLWGWGASISSYQLHLTKSSGGLPGPRHWRPLAHTLHLLNSHTYKSNKEATMARHLLYVNTHHVPIRTHKNWFLQGWGQVLVILNGGKNPTFVRPIHWVFGFHSKKNQFLRIKPWFHSSCCHIYSNQQLSNIGLYVL